MSDLVNISTKLHKPASAADIVRLRAMVSAVRQQLDWIDATIAAMLPADDGSARYQRQRSICKDRSRMREYLEGMDE